MAGTSKLPREISPYLSAMVRRFAAPIIRQPQAWSNRLQVTPEALALSKGLTNSGNALGRALNEATLQASPATRTGTASATGVMMGLGATCHLTPNYSSRVRVTVTGYLSGTVSSGAQAKLLFGTGANGVAATGTQIGQSTSFTSLSGQTIPVTLTGIITGLTPGTAYWFDVALLQSASSTVTLNASSVTIEEF